MVIMEMHVHSECHLLALYSLQVWEVKKSFLVKKCPRPFLFMVIMETACIPSFTPMHCMVCKFEKWRNRKSAWGDLFMVVMEKLKYTCVPSFTSMHCMVCEFEKWRSSYRKKVPEAIFCSWSLWKRWNTHAYQVSPPCIAWFASLRSEEVVTGKSAWGHFLFMVVMETLKHTCIPSFTYMHCMVC